MNKNRNSAIELLRIISMLMVLIVHIDGASLGLPSADILPLRSLSTADWWKLSVESVSIIGVNCFTLISGYFCIRLKVKSVAAYLFQCVFYAVGIATIAFALDKINETAWLNSFLVLTHTDLWYVPAYFALMLLSPILNEGAGRLSTRHLSWTVAGFLIYNLWAGWWWGGKFNPTGYTVVNLVLIYLIGQLLRRLSDNTLMPVNRMRVACIITYILSTIGILVSTLLLPSNMAFAYNSPFVILASVSFFMIFNTLQLKSAIINRLAVSAFAVYLIHKTPFIWNGYFRPTVKWAWTNLDLPVFTITMIASVVGIYLVVWVIDRLRQLMWNYISSAVHIQREE